MEDDTAGPFEDRWPALAQHVERVLSFRNVPRWVRDDIVQETGLRLLRMWDRVDARRSPRGLAATIALNLLRDEVRRARNHHLMAALPDAPGDADVEREGLARVELSELATAIEKLAPAQRAALLAEELGTDVVRTSTLRMLRLRARRRLADLLDRGTDVHLALSARANDLLCDVHRAVQNVAQIESFRPGRAAVAIVAAASAILGPGVGLQDADVREERIAPAAVSPATAATVERLVERDAWTPALLPAAAGALADATKRDPVPIVDSEERGGTYDLASGLPETTRPAIVTPETGLHVRLPVRVCTGAVSLSQPCGQDRDRSHGVVDVSL